ncbi:MAG TPA: tRNA (adenosine(37)-N6)-dimethylallyltransferase MiaA [Thermoanaerobaculia bacterium]|jgi:tRNA dimethylallyltransferase|nr:tRNA (adenosine(37)-N6)-dimethylallyltransferase MiaA [Thermoanaerobaculia bacterium]
MEPLLIVLGATATGKSALGLALAEALDGEIVNADALQAYRGFDIGTAKPSPADRARIPHHLIDILDPHERWSAGEFARQARVAIAEIEARGRRPILVGGSGLYLRALLEGISPIPPGDEIVRAELRQRLGRDGLPTLRDELALRDPASHARLMAGDTQRILRALEVAIVSGRPQSEWIAERPFGQTPLSALRIGLTLPRSVLYDGIAGRVARMVEQGWVAEVARRLDEGLDPGLPPFQAIGYRQLVLHVRGEMPLAEAIEETVRATRRFAKRQETWFRKEPHVTWFAADPLERLVPSVLEFARTGWRYHAEAQHQHSGRLPFPESQGGADDVPRADHRTPTPRSDEEI